MKLSFRQLKNVIRRSINEALLQEAEEQLLLEPDIPPEDTPCLLALHRLVTAASGLSGRQELLSAALKTNKLVQITIHIYVIARGDSATKTNPLNITHLRR